MASIAWFEDFSATLKEMNLAAAYSLTAIAATAEGVMPKVSETKRNFS
jgi:hypothetical protein